MIAEVIHEWGIFYLRKGRKAKQRDCTQEFKTFLIGLEMGALYSGNEGYYQEVVKIIDSLHLDEE